MDNLFQGKWINQLWIPLLGSLVSILYQLGHVARGFDHVLEGCKKQTHVALAPFEAAIKLNNLNYQCVLLVFMFPVPNRWREFRLWEKSKGREGTYGRWIVSSRASRDRGMALWPSSQLPWVDTWHRDSSVIE